MARENVSDECFTQWPTWDDLERFMPRDKLLYDPFNGDNFVEWAASKGLSAVSGTDFWKQSAVPPDCVVVTNPPFTCRSEVIHTLLQWGLPFIMLVPYTTLRMNIMNALANPKFVFWGGDQTFTYPGGITRKSRLMCLMHGVDAPPVTWIAVPVKRFKAVMCECGTLIQAHHLRFHKKQKWHLDHCPVPRLVPADQRPPSSS